MKQYKVYELTPEEQKRNRQRHGERKVGEYEGCDIGFCGTCGLTEVTCPYPVGDPFRPRYFLEEEQPDAPEGEAPSVIHVTVQAPAKPAPVRKLYGFLSWLDGYPASCAFVVLWFVGLLMCSCMMCNLMMLLYQ
jgi:hypothetical protein